MFTLGALQFVVTIYLRRTSLSFIKHPFVSNQLHLLANPQPKYHDLKMVLTSEQDRTSDSHAMRAGEPADQIRKIWTLTTKLDGIAEASMA